jgi:hypothetical protein
VLEAEVVIEDQPDYRFVNKLLTSTGSTLNIAQVRAAKCFMPVWRRRTRAALTTTDLFSVLSSVALDELLERLEAEVFTLLKECDASVRSNVHNRLRAYCVTHLIPRLSKETK